MVLGGTDFTGRNSLAGEGGPTENRRLVFDLGERAPRRINGSAGCYRSLPRPRDRGRTPGDMNVPQETQRVLVVEDSRAIWPTPDLCTTLSERIGVQVTRSVQQGAA